MLLLTPLSRARSVAGAHIQVLTFIALAGLTPKDIFKLQTELTDPTHVQLRAYVG